MNPQDDKPEQAVEPKGDWPDEIILAGGSKTSAPQKLESNSNFTKRVRENIKHTDNEMHRVDKFQWSIIKPDLEELCDRLASAEKENLLFVEQICLSDNKIQQLTEENQRLRKENENVTNLNKMNYALYKNRDEKCEVQADQISRLQHQNKNLQDTIFTYENNTKENEIRIFKEKIEIYERFKGKSNAELAIKLDAAEKKLQEKEELLFAYESTRTPLNPLVKKQAEQIEKLREALRKYGEHEKNCDLQPHYQKGVLMGGDACTCGLEQALGKEAQ